jgi:hypothetical protein
VEGMSLPAVPLTMSGLRELKGQLTGKPAHRPGRRSDDSDTDDDSDSDGVGRAVAATATKGVGVSAGRHFRTGSSPSASSTSGSSESESEEDEVMLRPVFRPKVLCKPTWASPLCLCCWLVAPRLPVSLAMGAPQLLTCARAAAYAYRSKERPSWSEKSWKRLKRPKPWLSKQRFAGSCLTPRYLPFH